MEFRYRYRYSMMHYDYVNRIHVVLNSALDTTAAGVGGELCETWQVGMCCLRNSREAFRDVRRQEFLPRALQPQPESQRSFQCDVVAPSSTVSTSTFSYPFAQCCDS